MKKLHNFHLFLVKKYKLKEYGIKKYKIVHKIESTVKIISALIQETFQIRLETNKKL